jgi:hypothetical protein
MLDRPVALAMGERDVVDRDVVLKVDEGLAAPPGPRHRPQIEPWTRGLGGACGHRGWRALAMPGRRRGLGAGTKAGLETGRKHEVAGGGAR